MLMTYISVKPYDLGNIGALHNSMADIKEWMSLNFFQLHPDRSEVLLIGHNKFVSDVKPCTGPFATNIKPSSRNLDVIFDQNLNLDPHINKLVQTCSQTLQS